MSRSAMLIALAAAVAVIFTTMAGVSFLDASTKSAVARETHLDLAFLADSLNLLESNFDRCFEENDSNLVDCMRRLDAELVDFDSALVAVRSTLASRVAGQARPPAPLPNVVKRTAVVFAGVTAGAAGYLAWAPAAATVVIPPPAQAAWPPVPHIVPMAPWVGPPREVPMAPWVDAPAPAVRSHRAPASNTVVADNPLERAVVASPEVEPEPSPPQQPIAVHAEEEHARANTPADEGEARADDDGLAVDVERRPQLKLRAKRQRRRRQRSRRPRHDLRGATKRGRHHLAHTQQQPPSRCRHH